MIDDVRSWQGRTFEAGGCRQRGVWPNPELATAHTPIPIVRFRGIAVLSEDIRTGEMET